MKNSTFAYSMRAATLACAVAALLTGCSKKPAPAPERKAYEPLAPQGTLAAAVYETKGIADNPMMQFLADYGAAANAKFAAAMRELGEDAQAPQADVDFEALKARELENLRKVDWVAFTMPAPAFKADDVKGETPVVFPSAAVVYCFSKPTTLRDIERDIRADIESDAATLDEDTIDTIRTFFAENVTFAEDTAAGVPIRKFSFKETDLTEDVLKHVSDLEPCYGLYDETLLILASSPKAFADTAALYEGKAAKSDAAALAADLALGAGLPQQRFGIYGVADFLKGFLPEDAFDEVLSGPPGKFVQALRDIRVTSRIDGEAMSSTAILSLSFGDAATAADLAGLIDKGRGMLNMFAGMVTMQVPALTPLVKVFNNGEVKAEGDVCSLSFTMAKADFESLDLAALITQCNALRGGDTDDDASDDEDDDEDDAE